MFKCSGICRQCGRCFTKDMSVDTAGLKPAVILYPEDFTPVCFSGGYGMAFDIGTTTVAATLWNLEKGEQIGAASTWNSQAEFGADVISRISFCRDKEDNLQLLRDRVISCINDLTAQLCKMAGISAESIIRITACGNTTMSHILAGLSPEGLAMAPFETAYEGMIRTTAGEMGVDADAKAEFVILPGIAGHVGGDITAGIDAVRLDRPKDSDGQDVAVYVDIGTNGEVVLSDNGKLYACSTAAGPAFEGGCIACGMRASEGAVYEIEIAEGNITSKTLGDAPVKGICGSGLIDAVAKLMDEGLMDSTGKLAHTVYLDECKNVYIDQKDIRELQLAKSAIRAGITALLQKAGKEETDINRIIISGAFGSNIKIESAMKIGLLPNTDLDNVSLVGNAAVAGAAMALTSDAEEKRIQCIASMVEHVELATEPEFQEMFIEYINF